MRRWCLCLLMLASAFTAACKPTNPLTVETIQVGKTLNSDNSVGTIAQRFKPDDTMYASVITSGPGSGTLSVKWSSAGRVISEQSKDVSYRDRAATEFHIDFAGGFRAGPYKVELFLDGKPIGSRDVTVEY